MDFSCDDEAHPVKITLIILSIQTKYVNLPFTTSSPSIHNKWERPDTIDPAKPANTVITLF